MSYEIYYQSEAPFKKLFKEHRFKLYYLLFIVFLAMSAIVVDFIGFPTVAGMFVSYIFLFSTVSLLFVFVPIAIISYVF